MLTAMRKYLFLHTKTMMMMMTMMIATNRPASTPINMLLSETK